MKNELIRLLVKQRVVLFMLVLLVSCQGCKDPQVRPGTSFDGSARWAFQIAAPEINSFASDAQIYSILGAVIWKDGRLPANTGTWSFVSWSPSLQKVCQVTVNHEGNTSKSIRDQVGPPGTGSGTPLPAGWANSTVIFSAIPAQEVADNHAQLVVFNTTNYPEAPDSAVWGINFAGGKNPLVRWDGQYIGTQFN